MATTNFSGPVNSTAGFQEGATAYETVSAAKTLTAADNGKTFIMDAAAGKTITLPALAGGLKFRFVVGAVFDTTNWIVASAEGDNITGNLIVNGGAIPAAAEDQINFALGAETIGDFIEVFCDFGNSQWIVWGIGNETVSITATDPA